MAKNGLAGMCEMASGYVINAKPGPDDSAYFTTSCSISVARNPIVAKTAKPAKTPVKQSHETTIHICLKRELICKSSREEYDYRKKLFLNLFDAEYAIKEPKLRPREKKTCEAAACQV